MTEHGRAHSGEVSTAEAFYLFTSIPPKLSGSALEDQRATINSWTAAGFSPITVNGPSEIERIRGFGLNIEIYPTDVDGKPLLADIVEAIRQKGARCAGIINADCKILPYPRAAETVACALKSKMVFYAERVDVGAARAPSIGECCGFDAFFYDVEALPRIAKNDLRIGEPWWDYWLPLCFAANGARLANFAIPFIVHKRHPTRWAEQQWLANGNKCWDDTKAWVEQTLLENVWNADFTADQPKPRQIAEFSIACFKWLRTRRAYENISFLPQEMESLETLLRESHESLALIPQMSADLKRLSSEDAHLRTWLRLLDPRRVEWRRVFSFQGQRS